MGLQKAVTGLAVSGDGSVTQDIALQRDNMVGTGKKNELPGGDDKKSKKSPPKPLEDDDYEDGDFATPKRDRHGDDDQPL
jgi:hypothetical protein